MTSPEFSPTRSCSVDAVAVGDLGCQLRGLAAWMSSAARHARRAWSSSAIGRTEHRHDAVAGELVDRSADSAAPQPTERLNSPAMISRSRSAPSAAARSIE